MGEFARYKGAEIKIGTCENMYYLRAEQAALVTPVPNSLDPVEVHESIRFRFPFPDEDTVEPGGFKDYSRGVNLWMEVPDGVEHGMVQFSARPGYLISLPCPESKAARDSSLKIHRNGFPGQVAIVQQRCLDGVRMLVCRCNGCDWPYRVPTLDDARPYIRACLATAADRDGKSKLLGYPESARLTWKAEAEFWTKMAERIEAGYAPGCGNLTRVKGGAA